MERRKAAPGGEAAEAIDEVDVRRQARRNHAQLSAERLENTVLPNTHWGSGEMFMFTLHQLGERRLFRGSKSDVACFASVGRGCLCGDL